MAKPIVLSVDGIESGFDHTKLDRARLYGARKRIPLDQGGAPCVKAALTVDGLYLLQSGMTAQGYFDEDGRWLQKSQLMGLDADGNPLELKPSTLGVATTAESVDPSVMLRYTINSVYVLTPTTLDDALATKLEGGEVFQFGFNYGSDYREETAFLVKNTDGFFCLVGVAMTPAWCEPGQLAVVEPSDDDSADELDFEMF